MRKLNLGCGTQNSPGFVGIDRFPMPGVDLLVDLDSGSLPFQDGAFDLIYANHSLEHVTDLMALMKEIWRVGKPGAQVCIGAPYYSQGLNLANPYHKQAFNEHTPRFWTNCPTSGVDPAEYSRPPQGAAWGLASSDNSDPGFDLRCRRMEFFYFADYWGLSPEEQRAARRRDNDVCEHILYHLIVFKPPLTDADAAGLSMEYVIPPPLAERREAAARARRA
jgi:SAM-dependent methyltransferase